MLVNKMYLLLPTVSAVTFLALLGCCVGRQFDGADRLSRNTADQTAFNVTLKSTTNTYNQAIQYGQTHPTRDGSSWSGWCVSLMWRAGNLPESSACPSAIDAYHRSSVVSYDYMSAPNGAFHWWDIGSDGHVAMAMPNGWSMMASCHVEQSWGDCIGTTPVRDYTATTGARYLGWSYDYAGAEIADVHHDNPLRSPQVCLTLTTICASKST